MKLVTNIAVKLKDLIMNFLTNDINFSQELAKAAGVGIVAIVVLSIIVICIFVGNGSSGGTRSRRRY